MDYDLIIPGLYLGNMNIDSQVLKSLNIVQILSIGFDHPIIESVPCKFIAVCDEPSENIYRHFNDTFNCIDRILNDNGNIYVHCIAGVSRSTTIVAAYLMRRNHWSLGDALSLIKSKRQIAEPNYGFIEQLRLYQSFMVDLDSPLYRRYLILSGIRRNYDLSWNDAQSNNYKPMSKQGQILKCKSCRYLLISEPEDVLYHSSEEAHKDCGLFYIKPSVEWIPIEEHVLQGKIDCPGCQAKLGKFNWYGMQCTCSKWIVPGFTIQRSKVDMEFTVLLSRPKWIHQDRIS